jgi:hypothetical protein
VRSAQNNRNARERQPEGDDRTERALPRQPFHFHPWQRCPRTMLREVYSKRPSTRALTPSSSVRVTSVHGTRGYIGTRVADLAALHGGRQSKSDVLDIHGPDTSHSDQSPESPGARFEQGLNGGVRPAFPGRGRSVPAAGHAVPRSRADRGGHSRSGHRSRGARSLE